MPPDHQRNAGGAVNGGGHVRHSATTAPTCPNPGQICDQAEQKAFWDDAGHEQ